MTPKELAHVLATLAKDMGWSVAIVATDDCEGAVIGTPEFITQALGEDAEFWTPKPPVKPLSN